MGLYDIGSLTGHGQGDPGACGNNFQEHERADVLNKKIIAHLKTRGLNVFYGINNYVNVWTGQHTFSKKFCFSFHLNSADDVTANGVEFWCPLGEKDFTMENEMLVELGKLGFKNRGVKSRDYSTEKSWVRTHGSSMSGKDYYKEIRMAWDKGISLTIAEMCFISNKNDIKLFNDNIDKIALICANAILGYLKLQRISNSKPQEPAKETWYNVNVGVVGGYKNIKDAENRVKQLKDLGIKSSIEKIIK